MLTTLRLASKVRVASLALPLCRLPPLQSSLVIPRLQQQAFCCDRPSKPKTKVCVGDSKDKRSKIQGKDKKKDGCKEKSLDCCSGKKDAKDSGAKSKSPVCDKGQEEFVKEVEHKEEEAESCGKESDHEECESSEEEDAMLPTKECEDELSEHSEDEERQSKAASEMCECVKSAVAKAADHKQKNVGKPPPSSKSLDKPGPCATPKEKQAAPKPKVSEHVRCCEVERSKSAPAGGKSGVERCKSFQRDDKPSDKGKGGAHSGEKKPVGQTDKDSPCECIKKALEKCKKGAVPDKKKPDDKKPAKKPDKKPDDKKKPDKKPDDKKKPDKKPDDKKKPDKKPSRKDCNKNKKPVVKCK